MKKELTEPISLDESKRFISLEKIIKAGVTTFISVGDALAEIKNSRLYRADFPTFQAYCEKTWNFTRMRAHQLIEASEVHKALPANVKHCFTNPRQLNALAKLPKSKRVKAVKAIVKAAKKSGGRITAKTVKAEVTKQLPRGGLAADAIRAKSGGPLPNPVFPPEGFAPSKPALEFLNRTVMEGFSMPAEGDEVVKLETAEHAPVATKATLQGFDKIVAQWETLINDACAGDQKQREKFGTIVNGLATRLMNPVKKSTSAYY